MAKVIDERWVDVELSKQPEYTFGAIEPNLFAFSAYQDAVTELPDDIIDDTIDDIEANDTGLEHLITRMMNQGREGSCVAFACTQALQTIIAKELGKSEVIQLSPCSLYKRIGRSASSGATVSDGISEMTKRGILPLDTPANRDEYGAAVMPETGFSTRFPADWEQTAKHFRSLEYHVVTTTRGIWTALCNRCPVIVGREGHSICYTTPIRHRGQWAAQYANSWSTGWGFEDAGFPGGFGVDTINQVRKSANWAVVVRSAVARPDP